MGRQSRRASSRYAVVVLAVAVVVPVASGIAGVTGAGAVPAKIVGAWNRNATQANWNKYGSAGYPVGVWTMVIKKGGVVDLYTPGGYRPGCVAKQTCAFDFSTSFTFAGARLTVATVPVCATKGAYGWKVSGRSLTLKVIADKQCGPREALFSGVWKRTGR